MTKYSSFHPLLAGIGLRLSVAAVVTAILWLGFIIATSSPGDM